MKKRGKHIKHRDCLMPLGVKHTDHELIARSALTALQFGSANEGNMASLYVLADIVERCRSDRYALAHAAAVKRLCCEIVGDVDGVYRPSELQSVSMVVSANILLGIRASGEAALMTMAL